MDFHSPERWEESQPRLDPILGPKRGGVPPPPEDPPPGRGYTPPFGGKKAFFGLFRPF